MNSYNLVPYIRYCVHRKCPPNEWKINIRTIPDNEFVLISGGQGVATIEGRTCEVRAGTLLYFYPGMIHSLESNPEDPLVFFAIHFSYAQISYSNNIWGICKGPAKLPVKHVTEPSAYIKLSLILKNVINYWSEKSPGYELVCNGLFQQFLFELFKSITSCGINYGSSIKVKRAMEYINRNLDKKLTVSGIAAWVKLTPDYLSAAFKIFTGYPVIRYINKCRIDSAKTDLYGGKRRIKDIALKLGFNDEFHFSKVFKKYEGMSPREFCRRSVNAELELEEEG